MKKSIKKAKNAKNAVFGNAALRLICTVV